MEGKFLYMLGDFGRILTNCHLPMLDHRVESDTAYYQVVEHGYAQDFTSILESLGDIKVFLTRVQSV
jgi:hypothetical protein